jgi:hypothetical protein
MVMSRLRVTLINLGASVLLLASVPVKLQAQVATDGWNGVALSNTAQAQSYAIVDATQFGPGDICQMISSAFYKLLVNQSTPAHGIVVDARGVPSSALDCSQSSVNPWGVIDSVNIAARTTTVLLPAGTINISRTWLLPGSTHIVGEGPQVTTIHATGIQDIVEMGAASGLSCSGNSQIAPDCPGIVIEHLGLSGSATNGIVNCCSQERSQVRDVSISGVGTGFYISDKYAENPGPYSDITMSGVGMCLKIGPGSSPQLPNTRVIQGLRCTATSSPAIMIDSPNNRLEDISISGPSGDGILIGMNGPAPDNQLLNIRSTGFANAIHISSNTNGSFLPGCPYVGSTASDNGCDLTIASVSRIGGTTTILDSLSNATIQDSNVGLYILGEEVLNSNGGTNSKIGYTRFTTAKVNATSTPPIPAWLVGSVQPSGVCETGSLYSCTGSCSSGTVWECLGAGTSSSWRPIQ